MRRLLGLLMLVLLGVGLIACAGQTAELIASTSPIPAGVRGTIPARGSDCQYWFLGLIPVTLSPDTHQALERAKERANVDVLTDVTVDSNYGYYILFSNSCTRVRGYGVPRDVLERAEREHRERQSGSEGSWRY